MTPAQDPCRLAEVRQLSYASLYCAGLWIAGHVSGLGVHDDSSGMQLATCRSSKGIK